MKQWMFKHSPQRVRVLGQSLMVLNLYMLFVLVEVEEEVVVHQPHRVRQDMVEVGVEVLLSLLNGFPHRI
jgi:hypothetical protein